MTNISGAAEALLAARRTGLSIERLPADCRPATVDDVYLIQDAVAAGLEPTGGWKVGQAGLGGEITCARVERNVIYPSGTTLDAARFHGLAVEIEFAFHIGSDLPVRDTPYSYDEVLEHIDAFHPFIEVLSSRYEDRHVVSALENLADANSNGAFIVGDPVRQWHGLDFLRQPIELWINGDLAQSPIGTHPAGGEPARLVHWLANHLLDRTGGLKAGDIVTTGGLQGATKIAAGARVLGRYDAFGTVEVAFC